LNSSNSTTATNFVEPGDFADVRTVVSTIPRIPDPKICAAEASFVDVADSYPDLVLAACVAKSGLRPSRLMQKARASWAGWRQKKFPPPKPASRGGWEIEQEPCSVNIGEEKLTVEHSIRFRTGVFAWLFWIIGCIVRFFVGPQDRPPFGGQSDWEIVVEANGVEYTAKADAVNSEKMRGDVAICRILAAFGIQRKDAPYWPKFEGLRLTLDSASGVRQEMS
jgi:hypothetical protein